MRAHVGAQLPRTTAQLLSLAIRLPPQAATIQSIGCMGFLNVGVQLGLAGQSAAAGAALALSGVCAGFVLWGFRRVKVGGADVGAGVGCWLSCEWQGRLAHVPVVPAGSQRLASLLQM